MGGLHKGHLSLIKKSKTFKGKTIVSIFINPGQFNKKSDYENYPRNIKKDLKILKSLKTDIVYIPRKKEILSFKPINNPAKSPASLSMIFLCISSALERASFSKISINELVFDDFILSIYSLQIFTNEISPLATNCCMSFKDSGMFNLFNL